MSLIKKIFKKNAYKANGTANKVPAEITEGDIRPASVGVTPEEPAGIPSETAIPDENNITPDTAQSVQTDNNDVREITQDKDEPDTEDTFTVDIRKLILIADSDEKVCRTLEKALKGEYDLIFSTDTEKTYSALKEHIGALTLLLLDVQMEDRKGMDILRAVKSDPSLGGVPVLALAADTDSQIKSLGMGAADFIPTPLPDQLIVRTRVRRCAELAESRSIIRSTERDKRTSLFNADYFTYHVDLFDAHYPDTRMDAVFAVVSNYGMITKHYGRRFADSVMYRIGEAVNSLSGITYGCSKSEDSFLIYRSHSDEHRTLLDSLTAGLDNDPDTATKVRLCLGVYEDANKDLPIDQRFDMARIAARSVVDSLTENIGIYDAKMKEDELFREQILNEFIPSLNEGRFKIYFQPKFDIRGSFPVLYSAEALVRWDHPTLGMMSPGKFISILEEYGLITRLDRYVWGEAAAQIRRWKDELGYSVPVSVNISRIDMLLPLLKNIFNEILKTYSLNEDDIILEITESAYDSENDRILSAAQELRGMGMGLRIELGSFGTGYSSIGMLSHMPVDALKIDMTFVHNSLGDNKDMGMIELIIDIADYLHVPVLAEGVETEEQYLLLKALGCDLVQGFYFSKPVPKEEFAHFISESKGDSARIITDTRNYLSISKALTGEYERIIYIDLNTDHYMQFYSGSNGAFRIQTGGKDFFADTGVILDMVTEEDRERIGKLLNKDKLMEWTDEDPLSTHFKSTDETGTLLTLETVRTRNQDDHHVVLGIRQNKGT